MPVTLRQNNLTKPSLRPCILARALPWSGRVIAGPPPQRNRLGSGSPRPCDLRSGEDVGRDSLQSRGETASTRVVPTSRSGPAIAATEASISTPVRPGRVDPTGGGAGDPVHLDEAALVQTHAGLRQAQSEVLGTEPTANRQCEPVTVRPSVKVTVTSSASRVTDCARERDITVSPRRPNTSSRTCAASASSPGSTRSRDETSTTSDPSASYALANYARHPGPPR